MRSRVFSFDWNVKLRMLCLYLEFLILILLYLRKYVMANTTTTEAIDFENIEPLVFCKFQPNGYDCDDSGVTLPKFYYDIKLEDCKTAPVGTCPHNLNAFKTLSECHNTCRDVGMQRLPGRLSLKVICRLQYDFGNCDGYYPKWYYDVTTRRCKGFSYSGCGGNLNRFVTQQICATACSGSMGV